jgi:hypothetical protein
VTYRAILCIGIVVKSSDGSTIKYYNSEGTHHKPYIPSGEDFVITSSIMKNLGEVHPKRGEEFSILEANVDHSAFAGVTSTPYNAVMLRISHDEEQTQTDGTKKIVTVTDGTVYGWIDKAEPVSLGSKVNTRVYWHVDWWLTGQTNTVRPSLLEGRIKRGPATMARPDTSEPRYWKYAGVREVIEKDLEYSYGGTTYTLKGPWAIIMFTATGQSKDSSGNITSTWTYLSEYYWPLGNNGIGSYSFPTIDELYSGFLDERIGINPENIIGCWISPTPPYSKMTTLTTYLNKYCFFNSASGDVWYDCIAPAADLYTDDDQKTIVIDPYGVTYATLPWGIQSTQVKCALDIGPSGAYLLLDMINGETSEFGTGRQIQIPLLSVPITSNAMSSYVLSGQRDYDLETAKLQAEQSRASGIANAGTSALTGAVGGAVAGGGIGAAVGAVAGLATSLIGTQVNYQLTKEYDQKSQQLTDRLTANQTSNVLISGTGKAWIDLGKWQFVVLKRDTVSSQELRDEQNNLGYLTDSFTPKCESIIASGGPIRIESLHVEGLCPEGNKYIQNLFQQGCYIDVIKNSTTATTS